MLGLIATETGKDTTVVFAGTLINIIFGGLFFIFVPRLLGPADYGIFTIIISTCLMAASIANFGLDTGILKFANLHKSLLGFAFKIYLILGITTASIGFLAAPIISDFLGYPQITPLLQIGFIGVTLILLSNFFISALQSEKKFVQSSVVSAASNILRIILLAIGFYFLKINLMYLTVVFFTVPAISVLIGNYFQPLNFEKVENKNEFFKYNFWVAAALIVSSIPFDNYLLLALAGPAATGIYAAPFKILTFSYQFGGNFTRVLASRYSSFDTGQKVLNFSKKSLIFPLIFSFLLLILIFISPILTPLIFGTGFTHSIIVLQILSLGFIFFFLSTIPSSIILYYLGASKVAFNITCLKYLLQFSLLVYLIPQFKEVGGAWAFTAGELFALILMASYASSKLRIKND